MSGAKSISLVGRFVSSRVGLGHRVRLPLTLHRVPVEGVGVAGSEDRSRRYQNAVKAAARFAAGTQLDAGRIDTLLVSEVLRDVEISLRCGIRCFIGRVSADDHQLGGGLAVEGESDVIEATFGFVVDADRTLSVALKGDAAEVACAVAPPAAEEWRW